MHGLEAIYSFFSCYGETSERVTRTFAAAAPAAMMLVERGLYGFQLKDRREARQLRIFVGNPFTGSYTLEPCGSDGTEASKSSSEMGEVIARGADVSSIVWWLQRHGRFFPWSIRLDYSQVVLPAALAESIVSVSIDLCKDSDGVFDVELNLPALRNVRRVQLQGSEKQFRGLALLACLSYLEVVILRFAKHTNVQWLWSCRSLRKVELVGSFMNDTDERLAVMPASGADGGEVSCGSPKHDGHLRSSDSATLQGTETGRDRTHLPALQSLQVARLVFLPVDTLSGIECCSNLRFLSVALCHHLRDIPQLRAAHSLEELDLSYTAVATLSDLVECKKMQVISVKGCSALTDLSAVSTMRALESLDASFSAVASLDGLGQCTGLRKLNAASCSALTDVSGLRGAHALEDIDISSTSVSNLSGLEECAQLRVVIAGGCSALSDLSGLQGLPSLQFLAIGATAVRSLSGLSLCPVLRSVTATMCTFLADVSGLRGAPALVELDISCTPVSDVNGLGECPLLRYLNAKGCTSLTDLSGLRGAPALAEFDISSTAVTNLNGLGACPQLRSVNASGCRALSDVSDFPNAVH